MRNCWQRLHRYRITASSNLRLQRNQVAHFLDRILALIEEGCRTFFVATIEEGRRTREVEPGAVVYVLDGLLRGSESHFSGFDLRPVLSSLGGQSALLQQGERSEGAWPAYTESDRGNWRGYYDWLPRGTTVIEYTLRLNSAGRFTLPPSRVEAMYAPAIRAQLPIAPLTIWPA